MNGKSAFPALRVKTTVCWPSALMSVIGATMGLAADFESSPRWWLMDATTSSAVTSRPLW